MNLDMYNPFSLRDFHVVVINLENIDFRANEWLFKRLQEDAYEFIRDGGVLLLAEFKDFQVKKKAEAQKPGRGIPVAESTISLLDWLANEGVRVLKESGDRVYLDSRHPLAGRLNEKDFVWQAAFELPATASTFGHNASQQSVAFDMPIGKGRFIILPLIRQDAASRAEIVPALLRLLSVRGVSEGLRATPPSWMSAYALPEEDEIRKRHAEAQAQLRTIDSVKALLYTDSRPLLDAVMTCLREFEFNAKDLEAQGKHDIEIILPNSLIVAEVTGTKGALTVRALRELIDHYYDVKSELEESDKSLECKGIFFVNHYRDKDVKDRPIALTPEAKKSAEREQFAVIPTPALYFMYADWLAKRITKKNIEEILLKTIGLATS